VAGLVRGLPDYWAKEANGYSACSEECFGFSASNDAGIPSNEDGTSDGLWAIARLLKVPENTLLSPVELYTDGACRGNPGIGGWGALLRSGSRQKEVFGYEENTTNNRMELMAAIRGLEAIEGHSQVVIFTDSQYVCKGITEWIANWKLKGWKTASGKPVKNLELWGELDAVCKRYTVEWRWVRGHTGNPGNERADALANLAIDQFLQSR
jgi:ribonuclease HI